MSIKQAACAWADYGFEYSDEEVQEEDVDIENQYYNSKGALTAVHSACKLLCLDTYSVSRLRLLRSLCWHEKAARHFVGQPAERRHMARQGCWRAATPRRRCAASWRWCAWSRRRASGALIVALYVADICLMIRHLSDVHVAVT